MNDTQTLAVVMAVCTAWIGWYLYDIRDELRKINRALRKPPFPQDEEKNEL